MSVKNRILSIISIFALAIMLTLVGIWAVTDLDFAVGGDITYTAPEPEALDETQYPYLKFAITDATNKTCSVEEGEEQKPTGDLIIPSKVLISGIEYTVASITEQSGWGNAEDEGGGFGRCSITSIQIPDTVLTIGQGAFYSCTQLTEIVLSKSLTALNDGVFYGCSSLKIIELPNSIISIGSSTFQKCSALETITIPNSVTSMGYSIFSGCTGLTSIYVKPTTPCEKVYGIFEGCTNLANVYVPRSSVDAYKSASGWSDFSSYVQPYDF